MTSWRRRIRGGKRNRRGRTGGATAARVLRIGDAACASCVGVGEGLAPTIDGRDGGACDVGGGGYADGRERRGRSRPVREATELSQRGGGEARTIIAGGVLR